MAIERDVLDQLLTGREPDEVFARGGLRDDLEKALSERIPNAELDAHLEGERVEAIVPTTPADRKRRDLAEDGADGDLEGAAGDPARSGRDVSRG